MKQLFIPLTYLRIKIDGKIYYDFVIPLVLSVITLVLFMVVPEKPHILGEGGYLSIIQSLIHLLIPFFIAALAAVATFDRKAMDEPMDGVSAALKKWNNQRQDSFLEPLTRREFLSYLFGYLSFISILLFVVALLVFMFVSEKNLPFVYEYRAYVLPTFLFLHSAVFWNLIVTSLIGLFFLTEKIHKKPEES